MKKEMLPRSEFSPDRNREWVPLSDPVAPPSERRRNLEDRYDTATESRRIRGQRRS
jgi:hypothetical protein